MYVNPARFYLDSNPRFFDGTILDSRVGELRAPTQ
jgi:hypothetical protein